MLVHPSAMMPIKKKAQLPLRLCSNYVEDFSTGDGGTPRA